MYLLDSNVVSDSRGRGGRPCFLLLHIYVQLCKIALKYATYIESLERCGGGRGGVSPDTGRAFGAWS